MGCSCRRCPKSLRYLLTDPSQFDILRPVTNLTSLISAYGVWLIAGMIALESVGIPVPGETVLVAAAIYAGTTHQLHIASVIGAAIIGAIVGSVVAFSIGHVYGYRLLRRYGGFLHLNESRIKIGQYLFLRHGGKVVFVARFVPVLRSVAGILAGANRMPWPSFMAANVAGAVAWVGIDCSGAYVFGEALTKLAAPFGVALGVVVVAISVAAARFIARHEQELAIEAERALPGALQAPLMRRGA
jgi:membrane protein DedA with SNARE-associated domain